MERSLLNTLAFLISGIVVGQAAWAQPSQMGASREIGGVWNSSQGRITFHQNGADVSATTTQDNGTIKGSLEGQVLRGYWSEDGSPRRCDTPRDGRHHWGRLLLIFDGSSFSGLWGYCYDEPSLKWTGQRSGTLAERTGETDAFSPSTEPVRSRAGLGRSAYVFTTTTFTGECPGTVYETVDQVSFLSETAPPAPFQRVKITNPSTGGFTDREYDERRVRSEPFSMGWASSHSGRYLALEEGSNTLSYAITNRKTGVVETGRFTIAMSIQEKSKERDFSYITTDNYCEGERETLSGSRTKITTCSDGYYYSEKLGVCPDGSKRKVSRRKVFNY